MSKERGAADNPGLPEAVELLGSLAIFRSLDAQELRTVAGYCRFHRLRRGELVFGKKGGCGRIFAIHTGEVLISRSADREQDISLATFVAGESFGELTLFDVEPAGTQARCEQDSTVLIFPAPPGRSTAPDRPAEHGGSNLDVFVGDHPRIAAKILHNLLAVVARRIRSTNRLIAEKTPWVQELQRQVLIDKLTGLYNAGYLEQELPGLIDQSRPGAPRPGTARPGRAGPCLLMIKPDNLKVLNDRYGHKAGDRILQLMAAELHSLLGTTGTAVRYKGDVFAVVLPQAGPTGAERIAERVRLGLRAIDLDEIAGEDPQTAAGKAAAAQPGSDREPRLHITVSVGIASAWGNGSGGSNPAAGTAARLVERAYEHLFEARNSGGDRVGGGRRRAGSAGRK